MNLDSLYKANDIYALGKVFLEFTTGRMMTYDEGVAFTKSEVPTRSSPSTCVEYDAIESLRTFYHCRCFGSS